MTGTVALRIYSLAFAATVLLVSTSAQHPVQPATAPAFLGR